MKILSLLLLLIMFSFGLPGCSGEDIETGEIERSLGDADRNDGNDGNPEDAPPHLPGEGNEDSIRPACLRTLYYDQLQPNFFQRNCKKASSSQKKQVNKGNLKKDKFLATCYQKTGNSCWCDQLLRPNPASISTFKCTYGENQVHQLIHPNEATWKYAIEAVKIVEEFEAQNLPIEIIYNWWRPEPYNKNVSGSASRHPLGTSIDVRFQSKSIQDKAFEKLCKMRSQGRIRAIGYYASTAIHFGVGDNNANTWGKNCP